MTRPHHAQPSLLAPDLPTRARVIRMAGIAYMFSARIQTIGRRDRLVVSW